MDQLKDPIVLHISLSKHTQFLLQKLSGISSLENARKRIPWVLVLETMNDYLKKHDEPEKIAKMHKKLGTTRKVTIHPKAHPHLHSYMDGLMKHLRTFKFDCLLFSIEDTIEDMTPSFSCDEEGVASAPSHPLNCLDDDETPVSTDDIRSDNKCASNETCENASDNDDDMDEFNDLVNPK